MLLQIHKDDLKEAQTEVELWLQREHTRVHECVFEESLIISLVFFIPICGVKANDGAIFKIKLFILPKTTQIEGKLLQFEDINLQLEFIISGH